MFIFLNVPAHKNVRNWTHLYFISHWALVLVVYWHIRTCLVTSSDQSRWHATYDISVTDGQKDSVKYQALMQHHAVKTNLLEMNTEKEHYNDVLTAYRYFSFRRHNSHFYKSRLQNNVYEYRMYNAQLRNLQMHKGVKNLAKMERIMAVITAKLQSQHTVQIVNFFFSNTCTLDMVSGLQ